MSGYVAVDTSLLAHLTKVSPHSSSYWRLIGERRLAISFQVEAELLGAEYVGRRAARLAALLRLAALRLPHGDATTIEYARVIRERRRLKTRRRAGGDAGDADVWIISSAIEYDLPFFSHDSQLIRLAQAVGLPVFTALRLVAGARS